MRLLLRLTTTCNNGCFHCPLADLRTHQRRVGGAATLAEAAARDSVARAAREGCTELAILRGESTLLPWLGGLCRYARQLHYTHVQIQTNGRRLADRRYAEHLNACGVTHAEISLYGAHKATHDAVARVGGAWDQTTAGISHALALGWNVLILVHVLAANVTELAEIVEIAAKWGVRRLQFNLQRAIPAEQGGAPERTASPASLRGHIDSAVARARDLGLELTTEAFPDCAFSNPACRPPDAWRSGASAMRIDDLHRVERDLAALRAEYQSRAARCEACARAPSCPRTWHSLVEHHSEDCLQPFAS